MLEHLPYAEAAVLGMTPAGGALGGRQPPHLLDVCRAQRRVAGEQRPRVAPLVPEAGRPLLLIPGDDRPTGLGGELADAEAQRDLGVEQVTEHLGGRPLTAGGPAREPASRGAGERATKGARRRRQRAHRIAATEPVMRRAAHRAGHRADPPPRAVVVLVMTYNSAP